MVQTLSSRRQWRRELSVLLAQSATRATLSPAPCASCWPNRGRSGVMDSILQAAASAVCTTAAAALGPPHLHLRATAAPPRSAPPRPALMAGGQWKTAAGGKLVPAATQLATPSSPTSVFRRPHGSFRSFGRLGWRIRDPQLDSPRQVLLLNRAQCSHLLLALEPPLAPMGPMPADIARQSGKQLLLTPANSAGPNHSVLSAGVSGAGAINIVGVVLKNTKNKKLRLSKGIVVAVADPFKRHGRDVWLYRKKWQIILRSCTETVLLEKSEDERKEYISRQLHLYKSQSNSILKFMKGSTNLTSASLSIAHSIAQHGKVLSEGEFIKETLLRCAPVLFHDMQNKDAIIKRISELPLSRNIIKDRIMRLNTNVQHQLKRDIRKCKCFSISLDETTDVTSHAQLAIIGRYSDGLTMREELIKLVSVSTSKSGSKICKVVIQTFRDLSIDISKLCQ
ncbi:hypothetical protein QTO34_019699 [Cnephaeus nilssonii]|uniref:DUF4371 domain-containing protein n=1 Tax=Cnephaeus nilssonii TaxID=3371016 RepID=A0AA40HY66_CNENI|nr:hypothetical protein QTO34_019699 [Eptesicus nilssonii]